MIESGALKSKTSKITVVGDHFKLGSPKPKKNKQFKKTPNPDRPIIYPVFKRKDPITGEKVVIWESKKRSQ